MFRRIATASVFLTSFVLLFISLFSGASQATVETKPFAVSRIDFGGSPPAQGNPFIYSPATLYENPAGGDAPPTSCDVASNPDLEVDSYLAIDGVAPSTPTHSANSSCGSAGCCATNLQFEGDAPFSVPGEVRGVAFVDTPVAAARHADLGGAFSVTSGCFAIDALQLSLVDVSSTGEGFRGTIHDSSTDESGNAIYLKTDGPVATTGVEGPLAQGYQLRGINSVVRVTGAPVDTYRQYCYIVATAGIPTLSKWGNGAGGCRVGNPGVAHAQASRITARAADRGQADAIVDKHTRGAVHDSRGHFVLARLGRLAFRGVGRRYRLGTRLFTLKEASDAAARLDKIAHLRSAYVDGHPSITGQPT